MLYHTKLALYVSAALLATNPSSGQTLERSANLQLQLAAPAAGAGLTVGSVTPGGTADRLKIQDGDRLLTLNGETLGSQADLQAATRMLRGGDPVAVMLERAGKRLTAKGKAVPLPLEDYDGAHVEYGAVPFRGGLLRDIYVAPSKDFAGPVVYFIQGFTCASMESRNPRHPHRELVAALLKRGIATYRVEKPGVGDSVGPDKCEAIGYQRELEAFATAYRHLMAAKKVPSDRIVIFGHSLGGIHAPQLASTVAQPRGVVVFGTRIENWADYMVELARWQPFWMDGSDPVDLDAAAEEVRDNVRAFHMGNQPPRAFAAAEPKNEKALRLFGWNGEEHFLTRHHSLWQEIARINGVRAWRDTKSHVLSIYGTADFQALNDEGQRRIAEIANYYRPGSGTFVPIPDTGHSFERGGSAEALMTKVWSTKQPWKRASSALFNPDIARITADWIDRIMKEPPVAAGS